MKKSILIISLLLAAAFSGSAQEIEPSGTYLYAVKDSCELWLDVYEPIPGSHTRIGDKEKPTIIYIFGGGFMEGERSEPEHRMWFHRLNVDGYRVIAIDYRLGLKGITMKLGLQAVRMFGKAIDIAVEDLYSATAFLVENASEFGIQPDNIVVCGSSAGAITALQSEWMLCNSDKLASILPEGFNYAGTLALAGAIFSDHGGVKYAQEPCPTLFLHGTKDSIVKYGSIWLFNLRLESSPKLYKKFMRNGYDAEIFRFKDNGHEIAGSMRYNHNLLTDFIEIDVMKGVSRHLDAMVCDPSILRPDWGSKSTAAVFKERREANLAAQTN